MKGIVENMSFLMLAIDELVDDGIIVTCDSTSIIERVNMREGVQDFTVQRVNNESESLFGRAFAQAKASLTKRLLS